MSDSRSPFLAYRFFVEIDHLVVGGFSDVTGLSFEADVETFREGGFNGNERQLPGVTRGPSRLVLKRGLGQANELWGWFREVARGQLKRRDLSILLRDADGHEMQRWKFTRACPVKWSGPEFHAKTSEVALESVEFVHEGLAP